MIAFAMMGRQRDPAAFRYLHFLLILAISGS